MLISGSRVFQAEEIAKAPGPEYAWNGMGFHSFVERCEQRRAW